MKKNQAYFFLLAVVLSVGLAFGCKSSPKPLPELVADGDHALVYFLRTSGGNTIGIWNGENPIGIIQDKEYIIHQTTGGTNYFIFDTAGIWRAIRADLSAGKTYYISFSFVNAFNMYYATVDVLDSDDPAVSQRLSEDTRVGFDDDWGKTYIDGRIDIVKEELEKAKNGTAELVEIASTAGK